MARIIPVLDLDRLEQGASELRTFLLDLRTAARDVGFFYLSGHGITQPEIDAVLGAARRFFALPEADKLDIEMVKSPQFRGYTPAGGELTRGKADWREQLDIGVERATIPQGPGVPAWTRLQGPNQWPAALPDLKPALLAWQAKSTDVAIRLLKAFALSLDQPEDAFDPIYRGEPNHRMKIVRYPGRNATGDDQGVGAHKDGGFLTLLLQDENKGLQVEYDGSWVDVDPIPRTLVVNIGELLELPRTAISEPPCIASSRRRPASNGFRCRSSSAPGLTPPSRCSICPRNWRPKRAARPATPTIRSSAMSGPTC